MPGYGARLPLENALGALVIKRTNITNDLKQAVARDDFVTGCIAGATILVFVGSASHTLWPTLDHFINAGGGADSVAVTALLVNVALLIFAMARHRDAREAVRGQTAAEERAHLLRTRDLQTELLNRQSLREKATALIEIAREDRSNVALLVVNLHRFKRINEMYGDSVGDALLRVIATMLLGIIPKHGVCGRLGSDEFALVVPHDASSAEKPMELAQEVLRQLDRPIDLLGIKVAASASIGLAQLAYDCGDFSTLLRRADIAMNTARESGDAGALWFDASMEQTLKAQNEVELGLRQGIPLGEFVPYYQPLVEFASGEIRGFEMLARWHHPTGGVIGPDVFIRVAEDTGLIDDLSEVLMRAAFEEARQWDPRLMLAVNVSPRQLSDAWLAQKILKLLTETGFPPERLEVEITESSLFEKLEVAQSVIASLKNQGVRIALDDFGTGYSSLAHLQALPIDRIKIDRSFVLALNKDPQSWAMVQTIAGLGKTLGVPITLEGVESAAIELRVRTLGCELGQGWFYGQAATAARTRQLLADGGYEVRSADARPCPPQGDGLPAAEAA